MLKRKIVLQILMECNYMQLCILVFPGFIKIGFPLYTPLTLIIFILMLLKRFLEATRVSTGLLSYTVVICNLQTSVPFNAIDLLVSRVTCHVGSCAYGLCAFFILRSRVKE